MVIYYTMDFAVSEGFTSFADVHLWQAGMLVFTPVVLITNIRCILMQNRFTWWMIVVYVLQVGLWFLMAYICNLEFIMGSWAEMSDFYLIFDETIGVPKFWYYTLISTSVLLLASLLIKGYKRRFHPSPTELLQEVQQLKLEPRFTEISTFPAAEKAAIET